MRNRTYQVEQSQKSASNRNRAAGVGDTWHRLVADIVQHPLKHLRDGRRSGRSCLQCIEFLQCVRSEIQQDWSYSIPNPDEIYASFHRASNGEVEHYIALCRLLSAAGFTKVDVSEAVMDFLPEPRENERASDTIRAYLSLAFRAINVVYG
jgi:hypothetical protein